MIGHIDLRPRSFANVLADTKLQLKIPQPYNHLADYSPKPEDQST
jgi:hypothetical protein